MPSTQKQTGIFSPILLLLFFFSVFESSRPTTRRPGNGLMLRGWHTKALQSSTHCWQPGYSEMKRRPSPGHICSLTKYKARGYATAGSGELFMNSNGVAWDKLAAWGWKWKRRWSTHIYSFLRDELAKISSGKLPAVEARPVDQEKNCSVCRRSAAVCKIQERRIAPSHLLPWEPDFKMQRSRNI